MQPHGPPSRMLEKSCVRVKWGAVLLLTGAAKSSFQWMTTVIGVTCLYSMIYLPAYCESAEALGSGVACYRLSSIPNLEACYLKFKFILCDEN